MCVYFLCGRGPVVSFSFSARDAPRSSKFDATKMQITINGEAQTLPSAPPVANLLASSSIRPLSFGRVSARGSLGGWRAAYRAMQAGNSLNVVALGASITAGCGSSEAPHNQRCMPSTFNESVTRICTMTAAFPRRFHDLLAADWPSVRIAMAVHAKNAVAAIAFARCTHAYVGPDTHLILLDVCQVNTDVLAADLPAVIASLRHISPHAAIVLLVWRLQPLTVYTSRSSNEYTPQRVAHSLGVDVIRLDMLAQSVLANPTFDAIAITASTGRLPNNATTLEHCNAATSHVYAQRGRDLVHPSPEGHLLIGSAVAAFVTSRLKAGANASRAAAAPLPTDGATPMASSWERCFPTADKLPWANTGGGGWRLVDDGLAKGVPKIALLSERINDTMRITWPTPPRGTPNCSVPKPKAMGSGSFHHVSVELSYKLARRESYGAFQLTCSGCLCKSLHSTFSKRLSPFPIVDTNADFSHNEHYRQGLDAKAIISATTIFTAYLEQDDKPNCTLNVKHLLTGAGLSKSLRLEQANASARAYARWGSSVRIDGMSVWCERGRQPKVH